MATTNFNTLITRTARRLQEPQAASPSYLGGTVYDRYSSTLVASYLNDSIREYVAQLLESLGPDRFAYLLPEMIKASPPMAIAAGVLARPVDMLLALGLISTDDPSIIFRQISGARVSEALATVTTDLSATATEPLFYDEGTSLYTLGKTDGNAILRYIILHQDISISESVAGNGKWITADGGWVNGPRTLTGTFNVALTAGDVHKEVMFRDSTKVYHGRIASFTDASTIVVDGTNLPTADIIAGNVLAGLISDLSPEATDLRLKEQHWGTVVEHAVRRGIADARRGLLQQVQ